MQMEPIKATGLEVNDRSELILRLSAVGTEEWQGFFREYWQNPDAWSSTFDKRHLHTFQGNSISFTGINVDDFKATYKDVAVAAIKRANEKVNAAEAARAAKAEQDHEAKVKTHER